MAHKRKDSQTKTKTLELEFCVCAFHFKPSPFLFFSLHTNMLQLLPGRIETFVFATFNNLTFWTYFTSRFRDPSPESSKILYNSPPKTSRKTTTHLDGPDL